MKYLLIPALLVAWGLAGCAAAHYVRTDSENAFLFLKVPRAREVLFASSHDHFQWRSADRIGGHVWRVAIHRDIPQSYMYQVDQKLFLPDCRFKEKDDFGSEICLYIPEM